jgi:hypothetical protein
MKTSTCQICDKIFTVGAGSLGKFCSRSCTAKYGNSIRVRKPKLFDKSCLECTKPIFGPNKFCGSSCSATYNNRLRPAGHPSRISPNSNRGKNSKCTNAYSKVSWCKVCGTIIQNSNRMTCSSHCLKLSFQNGGKRSAAKRICRSKDEITLFDLCRSHYQSVRHNQSLVNGWDADIIIDDTKTAVLWNGPWHYQNMPGLKHSLSQVQNRDKIKMDQLSNAGWKVLIFEDRYYSPETAFQSILKQGLDSNE